MHNAGATQRATVDLDSFPDSLHKLPNSNVPASTSRLALGTHDDGTRPWTGRQKSLMDAHVLSTKRLANKCRLRNAKYSKSSGRFHSVTTVRPDMVFK